MAIADWITRTCQWWSMVASAFAYPASAASGLLFRVAPPKYQLPRRLRRKVIAAEDTFARFSCHEPSLRRLSAMS